MEVIITLGIIFGIPWLSYRLGKRGVKKELNNQIELNEKYTNHISHLEHALNDQDKLEAELLVENQTLKNAMTNVPKQAIEEAEGLRQDVFDIRTLYETLQTENTQLRSQNDNLRIQVENPAEAVKEKQKTLYELMKNIDIYSRINEFVDVGHYENPNYLYDTSEKYKSAINIVREKQKIYIRDKRAIQFPEELNLTVIKGQDKRILDGQTKLMLTAFNIECDSLMSKVNPSNFAKILGRIEALANNLEKSAVSLQCGFNIDYIKLKFEECKLQYEFKLKKQEEQEEQRIIREQIREESRAAREHEREMDEAKREEKMYRDALEKARIELNLLSKEERIATEQRIIELEQQLADAEARGVRAKSMAEMTRRGHVYVISNVGSFGEGVYKIGLTRRLDPMDRVKELGDASVPFTFDVHAIIYSDDAPALETALHREFTQRRVNAVNLRKEFFRIDLNTIQQSVDRITEGEADFTMTIRAEEYYESRRLQQNYVDTLMDSVQKKSVFIPSSTVVESA